MNDEASRQASGPEPPETPGTAKSGGRKWKAILAVVLLVIGCILIPFAVTGGWVRGSIFDTEGFVELLGPLAENEDIQQAVSEGVTERLFESGDIEGRIEEVLPDALGFLAAPVTDQLQTWTQRGAERVVASDQFDAIWLKALEGLHSTLVGFLNGTGRVQLGEEGVIQLDLSGLSTRLLDGLEERGITIPEDRFPVLASGMVPLAQVKGLETLANLINGLNKLFIVLPILAVIFLAASVFVANRRQKAAVRAGIGIMITTAVFIVILFIVRVVFLDKTDAAGFSHDAAAALWGTLTIALRATLWGLFFIGLLLLIHPRIVNLIQGQKMTEIAAKSAASGQEYGAFGRWVSAHRTLLAILILILGFLVLALWNTPPLFGVIVVAVLVIVLEALVFFLAKQSELASEAAGALDAADKAGD